MPYRHNDADNQTIDRVLAWQKEWQADIVRNWDMWPLNSNLKIQQTRNRVGGQLRWHVNIAAPVIQGTQYVAPDYTHDVFQRRTQATLDFVQAFAQLSIPEEEQDFYETDPLGYVDLKKDLTQSAVFQMLEYISDGIWNGTGILPGQFTGLDVGVNDAVGANIYAGVNRTTYPRWEANVDRSAFVLWAGTVSSIIWPLYLRSRVNGKRPDVLVCSMSPLTAFHRLAESQQFNFRVNPKPAAAGLYHGEPTAMTFMDMTLHWGGDNMPAGAAGVDIFGLRMDDISLEHATPTLIKMYNWEMYQNNHFDISKVRINAQYAVHCPEAHFRCIDATVPADPTVDPAA